MADNRLNASNPSAALLASAASILANAASDDKSKGGRVFLNNHLDWDDWYREFQTKARLLWPYITRVRPWPVNTVAEPNALHFYNGDADEDGFDQADPQAALQLLDPQERSLFDSAWKVYSDKLRMQDTHDDRVNALKDWVLASVSPPAKYGCCNPDQDLSAWHDQLQATYGFGVLESKLKISDDYGKALNPLQATSLMTSHGSPTGRQSYHLLRPAKSLSPLIAISGSTTSSNAPGQPTHPGLPAMRQSIKRIEVSGPPRSQLPSALTL